MFKENSNSYGLLGILGLGARSGYDIKKWIEEGIGYFQKMSYGQLYPILNSFIEDGLATVSIEKTPGRPDRKVYSLTEKGTEKLDSWLMEPVNYSLNTNELLLKLFFCDRIQAEYGINHLLEYKGFLEKRLKEFYHIERLFHEKGNDYLTCRLSTVRYGIAANEGHLKWCESTIQELERKKNIEK
ncbi:MAG: PadR family transcriptional regulator [Bacillota bacterium]|nr:PadR family transcriptional regulator [Bacillota bacterium]